MLITQQGPILNAQRLNPLVASERSDTTHLPPQGLSNRVGQQQGSVGCTPWTHPCPCTLLPVKHFWLEKLPDKPEWG